MQPPQQQMGAPQPYYGYQPGGQPGMGMPMMIGKRMIFFAVGLGFLLSWIALAIRAGTDLDLGGRKAVSVLFLLGGLFGFGGGLMGALGSPQTNGKQEHGPLVVSAASLLA